MQNKFNSGTDGVSVSEALAMTRNALEQKSYYDRVMAQNAYDNQMKEFNDIQRLTNEIDSTSTTKEIQDLQARIQAQQGTVASEQAKLTLMANLQAAQDKIIAGQRERAVQRKAFGEQTNSPNIVD
jgi:type IV secretion system protein VirB5